MGNETFYGDGLKNLWTLIMNSTIHALIEDCSKTYLTTYDEIFTVDMSGPESSLEPKLKKRICRTDFELILILHALSLQKICLTYFYFSLLEC